MTPDEGERAARDWVAHLRSGGSTRWQEWLESYAAAPSGEHVEHPGRPGHAERPERCEHPDRPGRLPGAGQLELLRRLAGAAAARTASTGAADVDRDAAVFAALADRTLNRTGPGRGLPELPLPMPGAGSADAPAIGPRPVDPDDVPLEELVRSATGLLVSELVSAPSAEVASPPAPPRPRRRLLATRYVVDGAPISSAAVRGALRQAGHVAGGSRATVVLVAAPLDVALAQVWSARAQHSAAARWQAFVSRSVRLGALPRAVDVAALARHWSDRVGVQRVHVVLDEDPLAGAAAALRLPTGPAPAPPYPPDVALTAAEVDLLRRVNEVLAVRVAADRADAIRARLVASLAARRRPAAPMRLRVPDQHLPWLQQHAARLREEIVRDGYAVHGDPARLGPLHEGPDRPLPDEVLALLLESVLDAAGL
ncbi:hypothetical protein [Nocardioides mesophilus]|uniref:Uncharacterized protein n=1 Tax=Nocardioides mesophilus TaxID=433659 RepID=A0A7G9RFY2_9ACTN|nr:hypothetical protein [Nocardioides mesophilus]QNN54507.1 hypothetical protein H9L09_09465 [Nocardioides mesophilus]